ncbi:hypothetical protein ACH5BF_08190 [Arcobacter sp. YIC-464]|uniref:hypothetical protein n=1 Tax=Arcobacter sp. YIC-464 TaxID=3376631 RepID=UPI003C2A407A
MQILIFSLFIIALIIYVIYKIKKTFTKKELISFASIAVIVIIGIFYFNHLEENKLPNAFKSNYLDEKGIKIEKLSINQTSLEVLSSSKQIYDFIYIINKDGKELVCEAKGVEAQLIEDEYVFKDFKEKCRLK